MIAEALGYLRTILEQRVYTGPSGDVGYIIHGGTASPLTRPGRTRRHKFHDHRDFAAFLNRHADPERTDVLFDAAFDRIVADLEPRDADADADVVLCDIAVHPRLKRWLDALGVCDQRTFYRMLATAPDEDFLPINGDATNGTERDILAGRVQQLRVVRDAEYQAELDPRGFYRVRGGTENQVVSSDIPTEFSIRVPWYQGLSYRNYVVEILVEVEIDEKRGALFRLSAPGLDLVHAQAVEDVLADFRTDLDDGFLVGRGSHVSPTVQRL